MTEKVIYIVQEKDNRPNHILHLLLSVITGGLWLPVWFMLSVASRLKRAAKHDKAMAMSLGGSFMDGVRAGMGKPKMK